MALARQYQDELIHYQHRMQPSPVGSPSPEGGLRVLAPSSRPLTSAAVPAPDDGWRAWHAIVDPFRDEICLRYRARPEGFATPAGAVSTILRSLTRVEPPAPFLVTAAYLLWRQGLPGFCEDETQPSGPVP